jgi:hypothetical protein
VFHSVFWNMIQVTSCDDMMINRITAVGPFEGGTTKTVTRRGLVRSGRCSFLCTPGLVVTARLPLVRGSSRRPRARRTGHLGRPGTGAGVRRVHRSVRAAAPPAPTLARIGRPCSSQVYQVTHQPGVPGHAPARCTRSRSSQVCQVTLIPASCATATACGPAPVAAGRPDSAWPASGGAP